MIIKPNLGMRIFSGTAGVVLLMLACIGITVPFPGLIFTLLGLPLSIFACGFAFGAAQTHVAEEGILQRNFFFRTKRLSWNEIERGRIASEEYRDQQSAAGWIEYRTRTFMEFQGNGTKMRVNANSSGPEDWWDELRRLSKEKLGEKFEG